MRTLSEYKIIQELQSNLDTAIYQARRQKDRRLVIIKFLVIDEPSLENITKFKQEYEITKNLDIAGLLIPIALESEGNKLILTYENFDGIFLSDFIRNRAINLSGYLMIFLQLVVALEKLHKNHIIHKDIQPQNILINPNSQQIRITNLSTASLLSKENPSISNPKFLEGTLAYLSPEQTGRMNRAIDYRTDFYSLGVTFYEMLTGQLPFLSKDPMELVHCHIARVPVPPHQLNPAVPLAISDIVMKLLSKTAEERYQSTYGLKADLEICRTQLQEQGQISSFVLAQQDVTSQLLISQKLYGREMEVAALMAACDRVSQGARELMLVSGYSGIGKSSLVQEVYKLTLQQRGYFIAGKFDQFKRNIPYSGFIQAFQDLIRQLLTESSEQLQNWKEKILEAVGISGHLIVEVIPEVELIIGPQPTVPALEPTESQNRFNRVFQQLLGVFAQTQHPLTIFLDDLQWADLASLKLMQLSIGDPDIQCLLLIGAYRDNEVSATHPLIFALEEIQKTEAIVNQINLKPLEFSHINQLIADTVRCNLERSSSLSEVAYRKTAGNPFFLTQLLETLYHENLLYFDLTTGSWQWDLQQIQTRAIPDSVVELMANKIASLEGPTPNILKLAACVGNRFELGVLATVNEKSLSATANELWGALQAGLVLPLSNAYKIPQVLDQFDREIAVSTSVKVDYKFLHDRVQQAAYSLIAEEDKKATHLKIGWLLLQNTRSDELEDNIFEIVNHLNLGAELITEQSEKYQLSYLNLMAGRKAKAATAYEAAVRYLTTGLELLASDSWQDRYDLTLSLYTEAIEAEYLSTRFEQAIQLSEVVFSQARSLLNKIQVYRSKIQFYASQDRADEAIATALSVLRLLGIFLPKKPGKCDVWLEQFWLRTVLRRRQIEELGDLPEMTDADKLAAMRIIGSVISPTYMTAPNLFAILVFRALRLSLRYGNSSLSAIAYGQYGLLLCASGDTDLGYQTGQLALQLLEKFETRELKCKIYFLFNSSIRPWKEHIQETIECLLDGSQSGFEVGDVEFACYNAAFYYMHLFFVGRPLQIVAEQQARYVQLMAKLKQEFQSKFIKIWRQLVLTLLGELANEYRLPHETFDEAETMSFLIEVKNYSSLFYAYYTKLVLSYFNRNYSQAVAHAESADAYTAGVAGTTVVVEHNFYFSLTLLALYATVSEREQKKILGKVRSHQEKLKKWASDCPENYQPKYELVQAEINRILGRKLEAMEAYACAIQTARDRGYIQVEALANELAAEFYFFLGNEQIAYTYLGEAHYGYIRWGARVKVADLESRYPRLFARLTGGRSASIRSALAVTSPTANNPRVLDLATVFKASQALSKEIILNKLLERFMQILVENAGAQKGLFITAKEEQLVIEAQATINGNEEIVLHPASTTTEHNLPITLINYVKRTREDVILTNAAYEGRFTTDPYIIQQQSKAILCLPIIYQGKLTGILYLENNLVTGAFTLERLEILKLLTAQVAISIENAGLYTNLEQQVQERTAQLQQSLTFEATLKRITDRVRDSLDENQILETTVQELAQVLGVIYCNAGIYDHDRKTSTVCYEYTTTLPSARGQVFQMDRESGIYTQLLQGQYFQFCHLVQETARFNHPFAVLVCPIVDSERALGDLWLFKPKGDTFDEQEVRLVQQVANQCAIAIRQARLYQAVQLQVQVLEELNQLKDDFLSTVSHELRTPMSNMKMAIYMLRQVPDPERQQRYLSILQSECEREVELINDLLDLQRLVAGTKSLEPETIQLQEWIPQILKPFYERTQSRQQTLQVNIVPALPPLRTDPASLGRIVAELLNNACKYTPPEEQITVSINRIDNQLTMPDSQEPVSASRFWASIAIRVSNSGVEIPAAELSRVFEKFYRVPGGDRWKQGGTGLGLALAQKLAEHLGGSIRAESTTNLTSFTLELPI